MIRKRLGELEKKFCSKPVVVVTEKVIYVCVCKLILVPKFFFFSRV